MEQFFSVNIGQILQTLVIMGGGFLALGALKAEVRNQGERLTAVDKELGELRKVVVQMARQEERMTAMDQRMLIQGTRLDKLTDHVFRNAGWTPSEE